MGKRKPKVALIESSDSEGSEDINEVSDSPYSTQVVTK